MSHRRLPRLDLPNHTYYLTCCTHNRRPLLRAGRAAQVLIELYAGYRGRGDIRLHGYVIMPDHYHVLVTLAAEPSVSNLVRKIHGLFAWRWHAWAGDEAPALRKGRGEAGDEAPALRGKARERVWQRRFYDHVVRDDEDWRMKLSYLHENPVRAGLVECAADYEWSSASFWETGTGPVTCDGVIW